MNKTELAKQLNKKYQEIDTPTDWKTGIKTIIEWENLPATDRVVWEKMAEWVLEEQDKLIKEVTSYTTKEVTALSVQAIKEAFQGYSLI